MPGGVQPGDRDGQGLGRRSAGGAGEGAASEGPPRHQLVPTPAATYCQVGEVVPWRTQL